MLSRLSLTLCMIVAAVGLGLEPAAAQESQEQAAQNDAAEERPAPYGVWLTQDQGTKVEIFDCAQALCGRVRWMLEEQDENGNILTDVYNPDPNLRAVPILGLTIMYDVTPTDEHGVWQGLVYNPQDGRTYDFWLTVESESQIIIEGCGFYGLFCQEHKWQRAELIVD